jgi:SAM-dependent methyltransferase
MATLDRVEAARAALARNKVWYHTIELAPNVVTEGQIDLRKVAPKVLPPDLTGKRALDVGTFDGFWAFELERRGAEVVAIDVESIDAAEWPPLHRPTLERHTQEIDLELGRGFKLASELLGSSVRRVVCDVMDLTPEAIGGPVDLAFMGALLLHLRDPVGALERVRTALVPGGELFQLEPVATGATLRFSRRPVASFEAHIPYFIWWRPNAAALRAWLEAAGFVEVRGLGSHKPPQRRPMNDRYRAMVSRTPAG